MSKLPKKITDRLKAEADEWDTSIGEENSEKVKQLLEHAEPFEIPRPRRQLQ